MTTPESILNILFPISTAAFTLVTIYFMCRTLFDWKKISYLLGFLFSWVAAWYYFSTQSKISTSSFSLICNSYGYDVYECNSWLFASKKSYEIASSIGYFLQSSELAVGQSIIAGFFVVALTLINQAKASFRANVNMMVLASITSIFTFIVLKNITEVFTMMNHYFDFVSGFGKVDHAASYRKLADTFRQIREVEEKTTLFKYLTMQAGISDTVQSIIGFITTTIFNIMSFINLGIFFLQYFSITFLPSLLAMRLLNDNFRLSVIFMVVAQSVFGRAFILAQLGCIHLFEVTPETAQAFISGDKWLLFKFVSMFIVTVMSLMFTAAGMTVFIFRTVQQLLFTEKGSALV